MGNNLLNTFRFGAPGLPLLNFYATWDPNKKGSAVTLSNGNLNGVSAEANGTVLATTGLKTGKHYWEVTVPSLNAGYGPTMGVATSLASLAHYVGFDLNGWGWSPFETGGPGKYHNGVKVAYGTGLGAGDTFGHLLDSDAGTLELYRNNVSMGVMYTGLTGLTLYPACGGDANPNATSFNANFGASAFRYTPPAGYVGVYASSTDTNFSKVVLQLEGEGSGVIDTSLYAKIPTVAGSWAPSSTQVKVGSSSLFFASSGATRWDASADFSLVAGTDHTIEFWLYLASTPVNGFMLARANGASAGRWALGISSNHLAIYSVGSAIFTSSSLLYSAPGWKHIAWTRASGTTRLFEDGVIVASGADGNTYASAEVLSMGGDTNTGTPIPTGSYIDHLRITNGVARYTVNFTPDTTPF